MLTLTLARNGSSKARRWERRRAFCAALTDSTKPDDSPKIVRVPLACPLHRVPAPTPQPVQLGPRSILAHGPPAIARPHTLPRPTALYKHPAGQNDTNPHHALRPDSPSFLLLLLTLLFILVLLLLFIFLLLLHDSDRFDEEQEKDEDEEQEVRGGERERVGRTLSSAPRPRALHWRESVSTQNSSQTDTAFCLACGYSLRHLPTPTCPECGRPFDPADPRTMSLGDPLRPWQRWLLRPTGWPTIALTLLATGGLIYLSRWPHLSPEPLSVLLDEFHWPRPNTMPPTRMDVVFYAAVVLWAAFVAWTNLWQLARLLLVPRAGRWADVWAINTRRRHRAVLAAAILSVFLMLFGWGQCVGRRWIAHHRTGTAIDPAANAVRPSMGSVASIPGETFPG